MPLYHSRQQAGARLAQELAPYYRNKDALVIGLARGGIDTAYAVAKELQVPLDVIVVRKIPSPVDPELAIGAVDEFRHVIWNEGLVGSIPLSYLEKAIENQAALARKRSHLYRGKRFSTFAGKDIILVDDGIATGYTMQSAVNLARRLGARKVIVAAPVASRESIEKLKRSADEVVTLYVPRLFLSVGKFYEEFPQLRDEEVIQRLTKSQEHYIIQT